MYGKEYISDVELDPSKLLSSDSLGVSPSNTSLTVVYRRNTARHEHQHKLVDCT